MTQPPNEKNIKEAPDKGIRIVTAKELEEAKHTIADKLDMLAKVFCENEKLNEQGSNLIKTYTHFLKITMIQKLNENS